MTRWQKRSWIEPVAVLLLFLAALALRTYHLREIPPGLYSDEAANGLDVLDILKGYTPVFFERNYGREPLFIYLQAVFVLLFGPTPYALRLTAAVVGAATIPATYWMTREAFSKAPPSARWLAFWTAAFMAVSYWHITLSRIGFRAIMLPLVAALAFGFFWRAWWRLDEDAGIPWVDSILCGVFVAGSLYTYTAGRFVPLVIVAVALSGTLSKNGSIRRAKKIGLAVAVIGITTLILFAPLGSYYLSHSGSFFGRAAAVSFLNPESTGAGPLQTLADSALKTAEMFVVRPDPNLRHNPAGRPVFDLAMFAWLVAGIIVAVRRWRVLPYFFVLAWLVILSLPAILTAEGVPHSLRSVGMIPAAYMLVVLAMLAVTPWLATRWRVAAVWLPVPFLLLSGFTGIGDYFRVGDNIDALHTAFEVEFVEIGSQLRGVGEEDAVWVLPISKNYLTDSVFATLEFLVQGGASPGPVPVDESEAPERLAEVTKGKRLAYLLRSEELTLPAAAPYLFGDPKHLVRFLLEKHGHLVTQPRSEETDGIPYTTYALPVASGYPVDAALTPSNLSFDDKLRLAGFDYGRTRLDLSEPDSALNERSVPAGQALWAVLHWQPKAAIGVDLKASLYLKDESGHKVGQVDDLLVGDRYPVARVWDAGESANSYHILPTLPAVPPGRYDLYLKVYEDGTGRVYPLVGSDGTIQSEEALLGQVDITRSAGESEIQPEHPLSDDTALGPELALVGYDLPTSQVRPGESLALTLYWRARTEPARDYAMSAELLGGGGTVIAASHGEPANGKYPTSEWQPGEIVRDWLDVPISNDVPSGIYTLTVGVSEGPNTMGSISLGNVEVKGRRAEFRLPALTQPISATFGSNVALLGTLEPTQLLSAPGQAITLTLAWRVLSPPESELIRFVHVLGPDGGPVAQRDSTPCEDECPATTWQEGEILTDTVRVEVPAGITPGEYPLGVGWYEALSGARLPAYDAAGTRVAGDVLRLPLYVVIEPAHEP